MKIQVSQVKGIFPIILIRAVGGKVGDEKGESRWEVVSRANCGSHFFERDIFTISRKDSYQNRINKSPGCYNPAEYGYKPWLANVFKAGQEHRLSPSLGGMYSGHLPSAPGCPRGVTWPTLRLGVIRLSKNNPKSQAKTPMLWRSLAIGVIRNMGVDVQATFKDQAEQSDFIRKEEQIHTVKSWLCKMSYDILALPHCGQNGVLVVFILCMLQTSRRM